MDLHCTNCGRHYDVGDETARRVPAARCVCGARLNIASSSGFKRLGNYILERRLAVGGMGEIFYGKIAGVEGFEREVAIKKMLPHLSADRSFIDMMVKEAKLTVLLNHPNIVQVFDLAREGDEYYIAMEYVPGTNVGQLLELCFKRRVFLPVEVCLFITMKVLRGLAYAHQLRGPDGAPMNILHRDITPQNIMVTPQAWVKITDFGIAKARNEISTTTPGMIKGKLGYIAPEQMTDAEVTQSVDIFCAGILLWESLASKRLFKGSDEIDTFRLIQACRIPSLADIREDVSEELERVIAGALTPTPEERYASCEAYYEALNEVIFPRTIDDLESATTRYFDEHPELFDGVVSASGLSDGATMQVDVPGTITGDLPLITDVLAVPKTLQPERDTPSNSRLWVAVLALLLVIAGGAAFWITQKPAPETPLSPPLSQEEVQLAVTAK
ncbi:MAG: serine/threonine-protein kinase, partial [Myxococcota bacterium]